MTQTLRRELRDKFSQILNKNYGVSINSMADLLADAALEIKFKEEQPPITYKLSNDKPLTVENYKESIKNAMSAGFNDHAVVAQAVEREFNITPPWSHRDWKPCLDFMVQKWKKGEKIEVFARWWRAQDWRGQKGQAPEARQIMTLWNQAFPTGRSQSQAELDKILAEMHGPTVGELMEMEKQKNENLVS